MRFLLLACCLSGLWQHSYGQVGFPGVILLLPDELKPSVQDPLWDGLQQALLPLALKEVLIVQILRASLFYSGAAYEAMAPYTNKMEGQLFGSSLRRPRKERTLANKRIAIAFAAYRATAIVYGSRATTYFGPVLTAFGLNPNDTSTDVTTPVGIGNYVGEAVANKYLYDESNQVGDRINVTYNRVRYADYTGYVPVNTVYELKDKTRWQPQRILIDNSYIVVQEYFGLGVGRVNLLSGGYAWDYKLPPPKASFNPESAAYKKQADEILAASASLNDRKKVMAEIVDGASSDFGARFLANKYNWTLDQRVAYQYVLVMSVLDALYATTHQKTKYDSIRPISVIRSSGLYDSVRAWGGLGQGTVTMKAKEWRQYCVRTDPSPEYPSGAAAGIASYATVGASLLGTQEFGWSPIAPPGTSGVEPGTPKETVQLNFPTFNDYIEATKQARIDGGVHFREGVEAGADLGRAVGKKVAAKLKLLFKGLKFDRPAFG